MDVNRDNFYSVLPEIFEAIDRADYVAIDGEFTGILPLRQMSYFDTPAQRYQKHYQCDRYYLMIQCGLAMIQCVDPQKHQYTMKAYNFYLYPENEMDAIDFRSKSSSLQFLAENHFDFNQLFRKGIPFISKTTYLERLKRHSSDHQQKANKADNASQQTTTMNQPDADQRMAGFSQVIWKLQESGKPIIGHNLYTDIIHLVKQFFTHIPSSYEEYKSILKSLFPSIIDTKLLASTSIFQEIISNTTLGAVYKTVRENKFPPCHFDIPANFSYALSEREHTAGYDATCTGVCMTKMMAYIALQTNFQDNPLRHPLINTLIGKFFMMGSFDMRYTDMINEDDLPDRSRVVYVKHPPTWSTLNLRQYFQQWGFPFLERCNATTHIVALNITGPMTDTLLAKMREQNNTFNIYSYAQFHRLDLAKMKIRQPNPLFDVDPSKRNSDQRNQSQAQDAILPLPMDTSTPVLD